MNSNRDPTKSEAARYARGEGKEIGNERGQKFGPFRPFTDERTLLKMGSVQLDEPYEQSRKRDTNCGCTRMGGRV